MARELLEAPAGSRLQIGFFGPRNAGKTSLMNAFVGQAVGIVSATPGTTTDPVRKAMELSELGPVNLIDTAGLDDEGALGAERVAKTRQAARECDIAVFVFDRGDDAELAEYRALAEVGLRLVPVLSKSDLPERSALAEAIGEAIDAAVIPVDHRGSGREALLEALLRALPADKDAPSLLGSLVAPGDRVILVMPQDPQAPKGRLILPQVQTLRALLEAGALSLAVDTEGLPAALAALKAPPDLVITDSQVFRRVAETLSAETRLTSFSILMAGLKGDLPAFVRGGQALLELGPESRVLIAEACSHAPMEEDIGRVKLPRLLRQRFGEGLTTEIVAGRDFPDDLTAYDLVIHCGGCMFNRRFVLDRVRRAEAQGVPITNYGVALAALQGILDRVSLP